MSRLPDDASGRSAWGPVFRFLLGALVMGALVSARAMGQVGGDEGADKDTARINRTADALDRKDLRVLGLRDCIFKTLEHNLDIEVGRVDPLIREEDIVRQKAVFDPTFSFNSRTRGQDIPTASPSPSRTTNLSTDWDVVTARRVNTTTMDATLSKKMVTGADVAVRWDYSRTNSTLPFSFDIGAFRGSFNAEYRTNLAFTLNQPLLRGAGVDYNRSGIKIAMMNLKGSKYAFEWEVMARVLEVQEAYWQLVNRIRQLGIERESLKRAKRLLSDNRARFRAGTIARADLIETEAEVAEQQKRIVSAKYDLLLAENALKKVINDPDLSIVTDIALVPRDQPTSDPREIDWAYCVDKALNLRPDFVAIKTELEANKVRIKQRKNEMYPEVDLEASLTLNGLEDTFYRSMDVMSPFHSHNFFDAFIGVSVTVPLGGNRDRKAQYRQAQLQAAQSLRQLKNKELEIVRDVRDAVINVRNFLDIIDKAAKVRELRARQLEAKEIKRKAGTGIAFEVIDAQDELTKAEGAELDNLINYNIWLARLSYRMGTILQELNIEIEEKPDER
ncbi:MAG: TolC family protein [Planctomycetes bacterium]|nr:TolC family protein [Planctomycetota bacterium]